MTSEGVSARSERATEVHLARIIVRAAKRSGDHVPSRISELAAVRLPFEVAQPKR
ncbi:hypothetical protein [Cellulomonas sp. PhB150]|uniref:hypothetical protein n=1 Tax=Cellulomonas sp. PhB150 TaxID=2485188 RepID=UPI000F9858A6|nr:hypothetical protein [Cellulomonas sp. PhB150]ROS23956.1 hypothetical protein EDF34_3019 [Cellulomonas sp. PhB150]